MRGLAAALALILSCTVRFMAVHSAHKMGGRNSVVIKQTVLGPGSGMKQLLYPFVWVKPVTETPRLKRETAPSLRVKRKITTFFSLDFRGLWPKFGERNTKIFGKTPLPLRVTTEAKQLVTFHPYKYGMPHLSDLSALTAVPVSNHSQKILRVSNEHRNYCVKSSSFEATETTI